MNLDFWIFGNLEREFLKNESRFFWIFGDLEREFLKNESAIFWIFGNLEWKFLKNESGFFFGFLETWNRNFFKNESRRSSGDARGKKCGSTNFVPIDTLRYSLCLIYNVKRY